jgi:hypothetical protein
MGQKENTEGKSVLSSNFKAAATRLRLDHGKKITAAVSMLPHVTMMLRDALSSKILFSGMSGKRSPCEVAWRNKAQHTALMPLAIANRAWVLLFIF